MPEGACLKAFPVVIGAARPGARARARRPPRQRDQAHATRWARAVPRRHPAGDRRAHRAAGVIGPVGADVPILLDDGVAPGGYVTGANRDGRAPARRRARPRLPVRVASTCAASRPGDTVGGARDPDRAGDRGRQHLQARPPLLRTPRRHGARRRGQGAPDLDGLLRDRPGAHRSPPRSSSTPTSRASRWPRSLAPWDVELVGPRQAEDTDERELAERLYGELGEHGLRILYDDRDAGPGEKFADAELVGCPLRLTIGRRTIAAGEVEAQVRRGRETRALPLDDAAAQAAELWRTLA